MLHPTRPRRPHQRHVCEEDVRVRPAPIQHVWRRRRGPVHEAADADTQVSRKRREEGATHQPASRNGTARKASKGACVRAR
eukprot:83577-Pleurochrysis_carterae.AAC.1